LCDSHADGTAREGRCDWEYRTLGKTGLQVSEIGYGVRGIGKSGRVPVVAIESLIVGLVGAGLSVIPRQWRDRRNRTAERGDEPAEAARATRVG
jgi:hypothetical protein